MSCVILNLVPPNKASSLLIRTLYVLIPNADGAYLPYPVRVTDGRLQLGRLLLAPDLGFHAKGDLIHYEWLPGDSFPIVAADFRTT